MRAFTVRLLPGDNLQQKLIEFVKQKKLTSAFIITCVGSLTEAKIRLANATEYKVFKGQFEIVSLVGTIDPSGEHHLHISISDKDGAVFGGHVEADHIIYTTAEIVIGTNDDEFYKREDCPLSGWPELTISKPQ